MGQDRLTRIETKIDSIADKITAIDVTLAQQHESIKYHIKRTDLLESELKPLKKRMNLAAASLQILVYGSIIATIADVVWRMLSGGKL